MVAAHSFNVLVFHQMAVQCKKAEMLRRSNGGYLNVGIMFINNYNPTIKCYVTYVLVLCCIEIHNLSEITSFYGC